MRKLPFTVIPIALILVLVLLFTFYVPSGGDLISATGDYILGIVIGISTLVCLIVDIKRFKR